MHGVGDPTGGIHALIIQDGIVACLLARCRVGERVRGHLLLAVGRIVPEPLVVPAGICIACAGAGEVANGGDFVTAKVARAYRSDGRCGEASGAACNLRVTAFPVAHGHEGLVVIGCGRIQTGDLCAEAAAGGVQKVCCIDGLQCQRAAVCADSESRILRVGIGSHSTKRSGQGCP